MNALPFHRAVFALCISAIAVHAANERVSLGDDGRQKSGLSTHASISADGRFVAFASTARLHPSDTNTRSDVYVRDRVAKTTRLVSDDRGGDQPAMSANGRFVAFRSFDDLPRVRVVDLEGAAGPVTVSYPFSIQHSERPADSPSISPDGRWIAFIYRAAPFNQAQNGNLIILHDTQEPDRFDASGIIYSSNAPLGRVSVSANGNLIAFDELTDDPGDASPNGGSDVFIIHRFNGGAQRLSVPGGGIADLGGSHSPVLTADGTTVFFFARNQLRAEDTDGRASIYRATIGDPSGNPFLSALAPVTTGAPPLSLGLEAHGAGFLAYFGQQSRGLPRLIVRNLTDGSEKNIGPAANAPLTRPALSADGRVIAFDTAASNLVPGDTNGVRDVIVIDVPGSPAPRSAPTVTLTSPQAPAPQSEQVNITLNVQATESVGSIKLTTADFEGLQVASGSGGSLSRTLNFINRGIYTARASSFNDVWLEGRSTPLTFIVRPPNGTLGITGAAELARTPGADGVTQFTGSVRLDNRRATTTATMSFFGEDGFDGGETENVLQVVDLPAMAPNATASVPIAGLVSAPTVKPGDPFTGTGWTVVANLREVSGINFVSRDTREIFSVRPRLSEETPGPNGGVVDLDGPRTDGAFNPAVLQSIAITGPDAVPEFTRTTFRAIAT
jgi:WD40-like Beta Propeller Repeat